MPRQWTKDVKQHKTLCRAYMETILHIWPFNQQTTVGEKGARPRREREKKTEKGKPNAEKTILIFYQTMPFTTPAEFFRAPKGGNFSLMMIFPAFRPSSTCAPGFPRPPLRRRWAKRSTRRAQYNLTSLSERFSNQLARDGLLKKSQRRRNGALLYWRFSNLSSSFFFWCSPFAQLFLSSETRARASRKEIDVLPIFTSY